jgi:hypothetical protein
MHVYFSICCVALLLPAKNIFFDFFFAPNILRRAPPVHTHTAARHPIDSPGGHAHLPNIQSVSFIICNVYVCMYVYIYVHINICIAYSKLVMSPCNHVLLCCSHVSACFCFCYCRRFVVNTLGEVIGVVSIVDIAKELLKQEKRQQANTKTV